MSVLGLLSDGRGLARRRLVLVRRLLLQCSVFSAEKAVSVCVSVCECECVRESMCVCVCDRERERERKKERERERVCVCLTRVSYPQPENSELLLIGLANPDGRRRLERDKYVP